MHVFIKQKCYAQDIFSLNFRAEKSEVLSEDLQSVEKRVDLVKTVCQSTSKKIAGCLQGQGVDMEKRLVCFSLSFCPLPHLYVSILYCERYCFFLYF